ncbi:fungal antifreeze protein exerts hyperactivity By constructing an inequable beta-helix [Rhodocollybia butyracea]|uniref:Fungal antifreeze protein exerts hyperactivity By constructing an inequable beta-helix n=1 Tax=Rhodocollybia butyracea TaxID=206335 RepID=A0A9P5U169_9AGAR|nr:fungal antifreeze protein exerts hyperactivity By constructing an inequable beta-helix [Rhodocollybia butyracea]
MLSIVNKVVCLGLWASLLSVSAAPAATNLGPAAINLGTAGNFAILAQSGVSTVSPSSITGNIGVSPIAASALTGFKLTLASTGVFSTSSQVTGELFAASYSAPTPVTLRTAVANMQTAYTNAVGLLNPGFTNLASGSLSGLVLTPALYKWTTSVNIGIAGVTITGTSADVFVFQIAGTFTIAAGARVTLAGGVLASNIFWVVADAVTTGVGSHMEGIILAKTAVTLQTGATMNGRILAQTFVALQVATVVG